MSIRTAARLILGYAALVESGAAMIRFRERTVAFMSAMERAAALGDRVGVTGHVVEQAQGRVAAQELAQHLVVAQVVYAADPQCLAVGKGVGLGVDDDSLAVDHEYPFDEVGDLVDQVARQQNGARVFGVVGEQPVVEGLPGDRVQAEVGLVEEGDVGA